MTSLFVVSVPIGHPDDITQRAIATLQSVDFLVCEEVKIGRRFLRKLAIHKNPIPLNEHNETQATEEIIERLEQGLNGALFSDAGTPLFADPGALLIQRCHQIGVRVVPVPGASSLMAALAASGIIIHRFYYAGFLHRRSPERRKQLRGLSRMDCPVIILDTPYRLQALLTDIRKEYPADRTGVLSLSLTQPDETIIQGTLTEIAKVVEAEERKRDFVMIIEPASHPDRSRKKQRKRREPRPGYSR